MKKLIILTLLTIILFSCGNDIIYHLNTLQEEYPNGQFYILPNNSDAFLLKKENGEIVYIEYSCGAAKYYYYKIF